MGLDEAGEATEEGAHMKRRKLKPRNPIARVLRKLRPKVVPNKKRKLLDRKRRDGDYRSCS